MSEQQYPTTSVFDRQVAHLKGRKDVTEGPARTVTSYTPVKDEMLTWTIKTFRVSEPESAAKDFVALTYVGPDGHMRLCLPPTVVDAIVRQREAVSKRVRKAHGKRIAQERAARGELPGFMKGKK